MVKSVKKALSLLDALVLASIEKRGMTLSEMAETLKEQPTTVRNILKTMEECNYVSRSHRLYKAGPKCSDMAFGTVVARHLIETAAPLMHELAKETGESLVLATLIHGERKVLYRITGDNTINVNTDKVAAENGYELVTTRALLAWAPKTLSDAVIARLGMPGEAWKGISSRDLLDSELLALRDCGYVEDTTSQGITGLAVPIALKEEPRIAALGMYMPEFRGSEERNKALAGKLQSRAHRIEEGLE